MKKAGLAWLCLIAGCGNDVSTANVDVFIESVAAQACNWLYRCCKDPEIEQLEGHRYVDEAQCTDYHELALKNDLYIDRLAVRERRLRLDTRRAAACLAQLSTRACNPAPGQPAPIPNPMAMDECARVFVGNTNIGNECIYTNECVDGARCVTDELAVGRGVCVPYQKQGEICNVDADCDPKIPDLYCARLDYTCRLRGQVGDTCAYTLEAGARPTLPMLLECDESPIFLYCDPTSRTCKTLPRSGQPCLSPPPPGVGASCDPDPALDLVCDTTTTSGICRAPGQLGDDCSRFPCAEELYCDRSGATDVCKSLPTLNMDCQTSGGQCKEPYFCNFDKFPAVCDQPAGLNEDCSQVSCDTGLYCDRSGLMDVCKSRFPDGAICQSDEQCLSLNCSGAPGTCQPRFGGVQCIGR